MPKGLKEEANQQKLSNFIAASSVDNISPAQTIPPTKVNPCAKKLNQDNNPNPSPTTSNNNKEKPGESKKRKKNSGDKPPTKKLIEDKEGRNMDLETRFNELETRLSSKITENVTENVNSNLQELKDTVGTFDNTLKTAMNTMTTALNRLIESNENMIQHKVNLDVLTQENMTLSTKVNRLESEQSKLKEKVDRMESKELEYSLIINGIREYEGKNELNLIEEVYIELMSTIDLRDERDRWDKVKEMPITKCKRVGRYSRDKIRPICVEFQHRLDVEYFYANRRWTRRGIFIDKAYTQEVEHKRRLLRPILKAARRLPEYQGLCRLDCDELVLKGKHYTFDRLDRLPSNLNIFNLSSKEDNDTVGFFGELNLLSNFHPANFTVNGIHYTSSEQFIQHMKALSFNDHVTAKKIINAMNAMECKELSREIHNFKKTTWEENAKTKCKPGIFQKFRQNSCLRDVLIHCTGNKQIIESAKDKFWGTGIPLQDDDCLNPSKWLSRGSGIMGEILTEIREELRNIPTQPPTLSTTSTEGISQQPHQQPATASNQAKIHADVNTENTLSTNRMEDTDHPNMEH